MNKKLLGLIISLSLTAGCTPGSQAKQNEVLYVKAGEHSTQNGQSWETSFSSLQDALALAQPGQQIWVAQGSYYPTNDTDRTRSFELKSGVELYGGFNGDETLLVQRDWHTNETILSGNIGIKDDMSDNSKHVVIGADTATLDGFIVRDGYTLDMRPGMPGGKPPEKGGKPPEKGEKGSAPSTTPEAILSEGISGPGSGMVNFRTSPVVRNVTFINNQSPKGGAVYNVAPMTTQPVFINVSFIDNYALKRGGGMANDMGASPVLVNMSFINNSTDDKGGALYNDFGCSPYIFNALFAGNKADTAAAMGNDGSAQPIISHATFVGNIANEAGSALYQGSYKADEPSRSNRPVLTNSIIWDNPVTTFGSAAVYSWAESNADISYSIVEGGYLGTGNLDVDPLFNDPENGDYSLKKGSPAIDSGTNDGELLSVDINGLAHINGYDMGAFESGTKNGSVMSAEKIQALLSDDYMKVVKMGPPPGQEGGKMGPPPGQEGGKMGAPGQEDGKMQDIWAGLKVQEAATPFTIPSHVVYVNQASNMKNSDGLSWKTAYSDVQQGIDAAAKAGGGEVWIAAGSYTPGSNDDRSNTIKLQEKVALYGGFSGNEKARDERNVQKNVTILSGNIGNADLATDNAYHVVTGASYTILDGLTISDGYANGNDADRHGGGLMNYISVDTLTINNVTFEDNYAIDGGGIYHFYFGYIEIENSLFKNNHAEYGGALYANMTAGGSIVDSRFENNSATYRGGAVVIDYGSVNTFNGVSFVNNSTQGKGGAVWTDTRAAQTDFSSSVFENCEFTDNSAKLFGGAVHNYNQSAATISNSRFKGNSAAKGQTIGNELDAKLHLEGNTFDTELDAAALYSDSSSRVVKQ